MEIEEQDTTMASTKQDGTAAAAAAAEQLGSMSLGASAEKKDSETNTKNGTPTTPTKKLCSACGEKSDTLMKCRACKCVWYCDKDCQNKHWKEHKKECKPIKKVLDERGGKLNLGIEEDLGPLATLPPQEECPICMHVPPIHPTLQPYYPCCGKTICGGCEHHHRIQTEKLNAKRVQRKQPPLPRSCAFCRTAVPESKEEYLARLRKRAELEDPRALHNMGMNYGYGDFGLSVDQAKCIDLLRQAAHLGCPDALYQLGTFNYHGRMGLRQDKKEGFKYWERAAEGGFVPSLHNLGCTEVDNRNIVDAMRHWRLSASGGYKKSMEALIRYFELGYLRHVDLAEVVLAFYVARAEMKSEGRDQYIEHLKKIGKYEAEYDL